MKTVCPSCPRTQHFLTLAGRRYHRLGGADTYLIPNDETEQDRLDIYHHVMLQILNGELYVAPIGEEVHRVLGMASPSQACFLEDAGLMFVRLWDRDWYLGFSNIDSWRWTRCDAD